MIEQPLRLAHGAAAGLGCSSLAGCAGPGGDPDTADSATCDHGFLCGSYVDGDGDCNVSQGEWEQSFRAADTDGDGQLSQGEFQGLRQLGRRWSRRPLRLGRPIRE